MGIPPTFYLPPQAGRRIDSDGTIMIRCSSCGTDIVRQQYMRFSTAICTVCQGAIESGQDPATVAEQRRLQDLEEMQRMTEEVPHGGFRAPGFLKKGKIVLQEIMERVTKRKRNITQEP